MQLLLCALEDNEAVIQMINKRKKSNNETRLKDTQSGLQLWIPVITIKYVNTAQATCTAT